MNAEPLDENRTSRPRRRQNLPPEVDSNPAPADASASTSGPVKPRRRIRARSQPNGDPMGSTGELIREASDMGTVEPQAAGEGGRPRRVKKRRARPPPEGRDAESELPDGGNTGIVYIGVAEALKDLEEDVEVVRVTDPNAPSRGDRGDEMASSGPKIPFPASTAKVGDMRMMNSQRGNQIYIEERSRFRAEDKERHEKRMNAERYQHFHEEDTTTPRDENDALNFAVNFHRGFHYIGTCVHGFLCGFCMLHTIYVWTLGTSNFLTIYGPSARAFSIVFYILLAVACVSASDRIDFGHFTRRTLLQSKRHPQMWFFLVLFHVAIIINGVMYPYENHWNTYQVNATRYVPPEFPDQFSTWRILDIVRTVLVVLAWLVLAYDTRVDQLTVNLKSNMTEILNTDEEGSEMSTVQPGTRA